MLKRNSGFLKNFGKCFRQKLVVDSWYSHAYLTDSKINSLAFQDKFNLSEAQPTSFIIVSIDSKVRGRAARRIRIFARLNASDRDWWIIFHSGSRRGSSTIDNLNFNITNETIFHFEFFKILRINSRSISNAMYLQFLVHRTIDASFLHISNAFESLKSEFVLRIVTQLYKSLSCIKKFFFRDIFERKYVEFIDLQCKYLITVVRNIMTNKRKKWRDVCADMLLCIMLPSSYIMFTIFI